MNTPIDPSAVRVRVDDYIDELLAERIQQAQEVGGSYARLWQQIDRVVKAGGKRIRPYLVVVGYGKLDEAIVPIAAAQELVHIAMLIHDDIIDQDFVRHGEDNVGGAYQSIYRPFVTPERADHYANSAALMAGDALLSESYRLVAQSPFDEAVRSRVLAELHQSIFEVIGGELMDVEAGFVTGEQFDPMQIYRYKTSSYSFIGPLLSGAYCAGLSDQAQATLRELATNMGIAFQIQDDLLGVFGEQAQTGKSVVTDLREGKRTLLVQHHEALMNDAQRDRFAAFGDSGASDDALRTIARDMVDSGAKDKTAEEVERYFTRTQDGLERVPEGATKASLEGLMKKLRGRDQ